MTSKALKQKKITVLWGLPASGKTTYANSIAIKPYNYDRANAVIVDIDHLSKYDKRTSLVAKIVERVSGDIYHYDHVILDGLITTNHVAEQIMSDIDKMVSKKYKVDWEIIVWNKDVESCLHNDLGRRSLNSKTTISNSEYEVPSKELIELFEIKNVVYKDVVRKPDWKVWAAKQGIDSEVGMLRSHKWCLGGTWGNCWGNSGTISPDPAPASFSDFDNLLEAICPEITYIRYKKIYNECVDTGTDSEGDYYGGSTSYGYYECDLPKLYAMLKQMGYIDDTATD